MSSSGVCFVTYRGSSYSFFDMVFNFNNMIQVQEGRMETNHISDDKAACEQEAHIDHNEKEQ
jgi:hypothetical protein